MYIKQIVIQGFKSYKEQTVIEPLSPRHNVVVGRNGSGKSNFFAAIRFVLSDAYNHLSREERMALLHESSSSAGGAGGVVGDSSQASLSTPASAIMSAYVEIVFDNADNRFPTGRSELILRRTIGLKKDEYSLDRKSASKSDVMNLLESAGFSRSNPYYIVPQGRVTTLTNAKDRERLLLLKQVAGTQVYEQRRTESLKVMSETLAKHEKINELLEFIEERLEELEEEKQELKEYQVLNNRKRCLDYTLLTREQDQVGQALESIEAEREDLFTTNDDALATFQQRDQEIQQLYIRIDDLERKVKLEQSEYSNYEAQRMQLLKSKAQLELLLKQSEELEAEAEQTSLRGGDEIDRLTKLISEKEQYVKEELEPKFIQVREREAQEMTKVYEAEQILEQLRDKQGRNSNFSNKRERDAWLKNEIQELGSSIEAQEILIEELGQELETLNVTSQETNDSIRSLRTSLDLKKEELQNVKGAERSLLEKKEALADEQRVAWRDQGRHESHFQSLKEAVESNERNLFSRMDRVQSTGLKALDRIVRQYNIQGVYGPVYSLFKVDSIYKVAAEVVAGNSLFHVVVDTDATASKIMDILTREKSGRLTFMPLNRLTARPREYPDSEDVIPLISRLHFEENPEIEPAMLQIFSKTIVCPNLDSGAYYARGNGLSAITLSGDRVDQKGILTGGFFDTLNLRIDTVDKLYKARQEFEEAQSEVDELGRKGLDLEQKITGVVSELKKLSIQKQQLSDTFENAQSELKSQLAYAESLEQQIAAKKTNLEQVRASATAMIEAKASYEREKRSAFNQIFSQAEMDLLAQTSSNLTLLRSNYTQLSEERAQIEEQLDLVKSELRDQLYKRVDQLRSSSFENITEGANNESVEENRTQLATVDRKCKNMAEIIAQLEESISDTMRELDEERAQRDQLVSLQAKSGRQVDKQKKRIERNMAKVGVLNSQKSSIRTKIRELGALPEEAFHDTYNTMDNDTIVQQLRNVGQQLKKYGGHINKKAFEQYNNLTKQRDSLLERRDELAHSKDSIQVLIKVLDQRKDEAIERTFKQVSKGFAEIFERLVPDGKGRLIIQRRTDHHSGGDQQEEDNENDQDTMDLDQPLSQIQATRRANQNNGGRGRNTENYTGVGISVSFNSKTDEQLRIEQLSGGQKSLCALALIFAIQQCDPAPFYLFDEIDANLDTQYRTAVAAMIQQLAVNAQFICTTFRSEMIHTADKFYGVLFNNRISSVVSITRDNAFSFVDSETQHI